MKFLAVLLLTFLSLANAQKDPNIWPNRTTMIHLFEWKWWPGCFYPEILIGLCNIVTSLVKNCDQC